MKVHKGILVFALAFVVLLGLGVWLVTGNQDNTPKEAVKPAEVNTPPTATLKLYASPVWVVVPGTTEQVEAADGQQITVGTKIMTGKESRAAIIYPDHTVTRLDFDTEIVLAEFTSEPQKVTVKLEKRRIWSRVAKLLGQESYQSETNTVVATVRGTSYGHGILPDGRNKITAREGLIESTCVESEQNASVEAGLKTFFDCASDETLEPIEIDSADEDEWFKFNEEEDRKDDELYGKDTYDESTDSGVLGVSTDLTARTNIAPTPALVDCVGADGKTSRVTKDVCDFVNSFWRSHSPSGGSTTSSNSGGGGGGSSASNPTPAPTSSLTPYSLVTFSDDGQGNLFLQISGISLTGTEVVDLVDTGSQITTLSTTGSLDGDLYVSFSQVPCGATYKIKVNGFEVGSISDANRPVSCPLPSPSITPPALSPVIANLSVTPTSFLGILLPCDMAFSADVTDQSGAGIRSVDIFWSVAGTNPSSGSLPMGLGRTSTWNAAMALSTQPNFFGVEPGQSFSWTVTAVDNTNNSSTSAGPSVINDDTFLVCLG